jgi:cytochrome c peroxidase
MHRAARSAVALLGLLGALALRAELPPVPVPAENAITEPKRALGKILFWDEQLSSDNTVACGSCHRPAAGGADPRVARYPGVDAGTIDDVLGSPGIVSLDADGRPRHHPLFGDAVQATPRTSPSFFGALWAPEVFWDGRSGGEFRDPDSGAVAIASGGALENQVLTALANDAEMAKQDRTWEELAAKLERATPLALAADLPADTRAVLARRPSYPALFAAAFGDAAVTPVRIAFAIATYERTLVADRTPWDRYVAGDENALTQSEAFGWRAMQDFRCVNCHEPPLFTNNGFFNIGLRRLEYDRGRENVTGNPADAGDFKVPSLRNVGLRPRFMHTGEFGTLGAAVSFYRTTPALVGRDEIPGAGIYAFNMGPLAEADIRAFLGNALTDPRVREETFPFDRPTLRSERHAEDRAPPEPPSGFRASSSGHGVALRWTVPADDTGVVDYVLWRDDRVIGLPTEAHFEDTGAPRSAATVYRLVARDAALNVSAAAVANVDLPKRP